LGAALALSHYAYGVFKTAAFSWFLVVLLVLIGAQWIASKVSVETSATRVALIVALLVE